MSEHKHGCKAIAIFCIDYRLKLTALAKLMADIGYPEGTYDHAATAGSGRKLVVPETGKTESLLEDIEIAATLHGISEVVVLYHDNCGAYGIADPAQEDETERVDLGRIKTILAIKFPELLVKTYIIKGTPTGELSLQKI